VPESKFVNPENWQDIERGYFFQAAMYYLSDTEQPLRFLKSESDNTYTVEKRNGNFDPIIVEGVPRAVEQDIVITVKPRQVIVLSNNKLNQSTDFHFVQVAPVLGITPTNARSGWYKDLVNDKLTGFAFISRGRFGVEVDLTQISTIHKSMLLKKQTKVPVNRLEFIDSHIVELLDL
jgi:hypothetical protein